MLYVQAIKKGFQQELPDIWLTNGNPWEIARPEVTYKVGFYGSVDKSKWTPAEQARALPPQVWLLLCLLCLAIWRPFQCSAGRQGCLLATHCFQG